MNDDTAMKPYQVYAQQFVERTPYCGLFLDCGLGKALDNETIIPTPNGFQKLGSLLPGDAVFDMNGKQQTIQAVFRHSQKTAYRVTLADSRSFIACDEHLIVFFTENDRRLQVKPLKDIMEMPRPIYLPNCGAVKYGRDKTGNKSPGEQAQIILNLKPGDKLPDNILQQFTPIRQKIFNRLLQQSLPYNNEKTVHMLPMPCKQAAQEAAKLFWSLGYNASPHNDKLIFWTDINDGRVCQSITSIEPVEPRNMTCLTVNGPTKTFLIDNYVVTHNTRITLEALMRLNPKQHVLVIAPKTIARSSWLNEIKKWGMPLRTKSLVVDEKDRLLTRKKRLALYDEIPTALPSIYFINRDLFNDLVKYFCDSKDRPALWYFSTVILDESQGFKSHSSQRFKAMKRIRPAVSRVVELTGTPVPKSLMDLWSQIYILDEGERLGKTITAYRNRWFYPTKWANGYAVDWAPKPGAKEEIYALIKDIVISMDNTELNLPPLNTNFIHVSMDPDEQKLYKKFAREQVLDLDSGETVTAVNAAVLQAKLSQMASGAIYTDATRHVFTKIHDKKLDAVEHIINTTGSPVLIAYWFHSDLVMLQERFPNSVRFDGSARLMDEWNAGNIPVMLLQPASSGHGINIQFGGHTLVWYTLPWSLEYHEQTIKRLLRQGQTHPVMVHYILTEHTVDSRIKRSIDTKQMNEQDLLDAVKVTLEDAAAMAAD